MKNLFVLRHAKSSWQNERLEDFERPLSKRGIKNAPEIAARFKQKQIKLDLIICSNSKRTTETINLFLGVVDYKNEIIFTDKLYLASYRALLEILQSVGQKNKNVLIVGHNPGVTDLVNYLGNLFIDNIPTSGIAALCFEGAWKDLKKNSCKLLFFDYPQKEI